MEKLVHSGKARSIGVSNFTIAQLQTLLSYAKIWPIINQVESHPFLPQVDLLEFCKANDILFVAYSPLGSQMTHRDDGTPVRRLLEDDIVSYNLFVMTSQCSHYRLLPLRKRST